MFTRKLKFKRKIQFLKEFEANVFLFPPLTPGYLAKCVFYVAHRPRPKKHSLGLCILRIFVYPIPCRRDAILEAIFQIKRPNTQ